MSEMHYLLLSVYHSTCDLDSFQISGIAFFFSSIGQSISILYMYILHSCVYVYGKVSCRLQ
jgi:hypothetical protein